jgi:hypothetical protein
MTDLEPMTDEQINQMTIQEWLEMLAQLWTAVGKPIDPERLNVYRQALETIPLRLLELAVRRVIRENQYQVVLLPGAVEEALRKELGGPWEVNLALERRETIQDVTGVTLVDESGNRHRN